MGADSGLHLFLECGLGGFQLSFINIQRRCCPPLHHHTHIGGFQREDPRVVDYDKLPPVGIWYSDYKNTGAYMVTKGNPHMLSQRFFVLHISVYQKHTLIILQIFLNNMAIPGPFRF